MVLSCRIRGNVSNTTVTTLFALQATSLQSPVSQGLYPVLAVSSISIGLFLSALFFM